MFLKAQQGQTNYSARRSDLNLFFEMSKTFPIDQYVISLAYQVAEPVLKSPELTSTSSVTILLSHHALDTCCGKHGRVRLGTPASECVPGRQCPAHPARGQPLSRPLAQTSILHPAPAEGPGAGLFSFLQSAPSLCPPQPGGRLHDLLHCGKLPLAPSGPSFNLNVSASTPDTPLPPLRKRRPPETQGRHPPRTSVSATLSA